MTHLAWAFEEQGGARSLDLGEWGVIVLGMAIIVYIVLMGIRGGGFDG